jgi:hypothetical protein
MVKVFGDRVPGFTSPFFGTPADGLKCHVRVGWANSQKF